MPWILEGIGRSSNAGGRILLQSPLVAPRASHRHRVREEHIQAPIGELAALGAAMIWAFTSLIFTEAGRLATPLAANTFKVTLATLVFGLLLWARTGVPWATHIESGDLLLLAASGICGLAVGDSLLFFGMQALGARRANLVFALAPVMGAIGGYFLLGERLGLVALLGMAAAIGGVAWVVSERRDIVRGGRFLLTGAAADLQHITHPLEGRVAIGVLVTIVAALTQAIAAVLAKPALARVGSIEATQIRVAAAAAGLLLLGAAGRRLGFWTGLIIRRRLYPGMALASLLGTFVGVWLMTVALEHTSTGVALTLISTPPIWLLPLGAWLQSDHPTRREIVGLFVALGGVAVLLLLAA